MEVEASPSATGRVLAIGDVHGCHTALCTLLDRLMITSHDTLIFLGDLVDRGPATRAVLDEVCSLQQSVRTVLIQGNHEEMFLAAVNLGHELTADVLVKHPGHADWLAWGGRETVASYGGCLANVPVEHVNLLQLMLPYWETETEIFVHAQVRPEIDLPLQGPATLRWRKLTGKEPLHKSGRRVICGHTSQKKGRPLIYPGGICIDTYACGGQWLSCLDVGGDEILQVSTDGKKLRKLRLNAAAKRGYIKVETNMLGDSLE